MSKIRTIKKLKETLNVFSISAYFQKNRKSNKGITKIDKDTFDRIKRIINAPDPIQDVPCLLDTWMPKPPTGPAVITGGRKTTKRKTTKRKTTKRKTTKRKTPKRKSKARMTKQKRKVNGVTRNVRISTTGRKYVLLKGKRHFL